MRRKGTLVAVVPLAEGEGDSRGALGSPYGGSFGGPAVGPGLGAADHVAILDALAAYARAGGFSALWISSRPAPYRFHGDGVELALAAAGARVVTREVTHIADLGGGEAARRARVRGTSRRGARKAERLGTRVRAGGAADLPAFHALLAADRARLGARPTHTRSELERLWNTDPDDYLLLVAENAGALVGAQLLFRATPRIALSFYTARADAPEAERCMNLLTERALEECAARGFAAVDFGTSSIGGALNRGLSEFKEGFGGRPFVRETWRLDLG